MPPCWFTHNVSYLCYSNSRDTECTGWSVLLKIVNTDFFMMNINYSVAYFIFLVRSVLIL